LYPLGLGQDQEVRDDGTDGEGSDGNLQLRDVQALGSSHDDLQHEPEHLEDGDEFDEDIVFAFVVEAGGGNVGKRRQVFRVSEIEDLRCEEVEWYGILPKLRHEQAASELGGPSTPSHG